VTEAEITSGMEPSPDAPERDLIPVRTASGTLQVHQAPLCSASGSKLKGLWGRCPQPPSPCGFAHVGDRCPLLGLLPQAPMPMRFQVPGACCSWLRLDHMPFLALGSCFAPQRKRYSAGAPERSTED
jgi:hypothetical protein